MSRFSHLQSIILLLGLGVLFACDSSKNEVNLEAEYFHESMKTLTDIIVHDILSPPVASRIYMYPSVAAYECIVQEKDSERQSLAGQLNGLTELPTSIENINYQAAAIVAFLDVGQDLVFSTEKMEEYEQTMHKELKQMVGSKIFSDSKAHGLLIASHIKEWMAEDNYHQTRTFPKFSVDFDSESRWQPTPPDYMEGIEPHWRAIRPAVLDSAQQFVPIAPPLFSLDKGSQFEQELMEVYSVTNELTDESEEVTIAKFWDCNPFVSTHKGHFMFAVKKISPGGHWIGITKEACLKDGSDFSTSVSAYALVSLALFDGFISCWDEKYRSNLIRPETLINKHVDDKWKPLLQTPPFPEYTSGHSVISASASVALTNFFGENFAFTDSTEVEYGLPVRSFSSFYEAADEAAISRLYGGIHYRSAIDNGVSQGKQVGQYIVDNIVWQEDVLAAN